MSEEKKKRPIETLRDGAIEVSIWQRETDRGQSYSTQRTRAYQDKEGNWQRSSAIPERDLLRAARLDEQAYSSIQALREQDRLKDARSGSGRRSRSRERDR